MSNILEQISLQMMKGMGLGLEKGTDPVKAMLQGQQMRKGRQDMQVKSMEMQEYAEQKGRERRLRNSMKGADFGDYESTSEAAQAASDIGEYEKAMKIQTLAEKQKTKPTDAFGPMQEIKVGGIVTGVGQYDKEGKIHNFKTNKQLKKGGSGLAKPTKARTPTKEQITRGTSMIENSTVFGSGGETSFGLDKKDNKLMGRLAAARGQKLVSDAKQLGQTISDETGMSLAIQELEGMKDTIIQEDFFGRSIKDQDKIAFPAGISSVLQNYLGVDAPSGDGYEYRTLPNGTQQRRKK